MLNQNKTTYRPSFQADLHITKGAEKILRKDFDKSVNAVYVSNIQITPKFDEYKKTLVDEFKSVTKDIEGTVRLSTDKNNRKLNVNYKSNNANKYLSNKLKFPGSKHKVHTEISPKDLHEPVGLTAYNGSHKVAPRIDKIIMMCSDLVSASTKEWNSADNKFYIFWKKNISKKK